MPDACLHCRLQEEEAERRMSLETAQKQERQSWQRVLRSEDPHTVAGGAEPPGLHEPPAWQAMVSAGAPRLKATNSQTELTCRPVPN